MTKCDQQLSRLLIKDCPFWSIEEGIYSVLPTPGSHQYDTKATLYDLLIGTRSYNRIIWGASPHSYVRFASQAVTSHSDGWLLDAGCGSMLFSAQAHLESNRPVLACDQSLGMLRRARQRLLKLAGAAPERILLLQADIMALPFLPTCFQTILCMNVLHHCQEAAGLTLCLKELLADGGQIYLTSLVINHRLIGDYYLKALHRQGWIARPRKSAGLEVLLRDSLKRGINYRVEGNMAYAMTFTM